MADVTSISTIAYNIIAGVITVLTFGAGALTAIITMKGKYVLKTECLEARKEEDEHQSMFDKSMSDNVCGRLEHLEDKVNELQEQNLEHYGMIKEIHGMLRRMNGFH